MNTIQYATGFRELHLVPFIYSLPENPEDYQTAEARMKVHIEKLCQEYQKEYGIYNTYGLAAQFSRSQPNRKCLDFT
jgi:hypothetical protein